MKDLHREGTPYGIHSRIDYNAPVFQPEARDQMARGDCMAVGPYYLNTKKSVRPTMRTFLLGVIVSIVLTTMGGQAAGKDGAGGSGRPPLMNEERERQFQLQLDQMRHQTELEQARMHGKKKPC